MGEPARALRVLLIDDGHVVMEQRVPIGATAVLRREGAARLDVADADDAICLTWDGADGTALVPPGAVGEVRGFRGTWRFDHDGDAGGARATVPLSAGNHGRIALGDRVLLFRVVSASAPASLGVETDLRPLLCDDDEVLAVSYGGAGGLAAVLLALVWSAAPTPTTALVREPPRFASIALGPMPSAPEVVAPTSEIGTTGDESTGDPTHEPAAAPVAPRGSADGMGMFAIIRTRGVGLDRLTGADDEGYGDALDAVAMGDLPGDPSGVRRDGAVWGDRSVSWSPQTLDLRVDIGGPAEIKLGRVTPVAPSDEEFVCYEPELVRSTVDVLAGQLVYCYERELRADPGLGGRVDVEWDIVGGRTRNVRILSNTSGSVGLQECVRTRVERWRFPQGTDGGIVYPFVFEPKS